jgi:hypothetical protein
MNEHEFLQAEAEGIAKRKTEPLSPRQMIADRTADEIMSLSESGCMDKEIVELILMSAFIQVEQIGLFRWMGDLSKALKTRAEVA